MHCGDSFTPNLRPEIAVPVLEIYRGSTPLTGTMSARCWQDLKHTQMESKEKEVGPMEAKRPELFHFRKDVPLSNWELYLLIMALMSHNHSQEMALFDGLVTKENMEFHMEMIAFREDLLARLKQFKALSHEYGN